jgi:uncharacterized membrane protein
MKKILILAFLFYFLLPSGILARQYVYDWYIKDFKTEITVNKDSSLFITERITADCGDAAGKHGIFRVLPTQIKTTEGRIKTPIELISITDFNDKPLKYQTIKNYSNHTITWKIGDPNKTVRGVNYYKIVYRVKNAIRFQNPGFDEFYWNLNGNFWDLETDSFTAKIIFPREVNQNNTQIDYYTGLLGSKSKNLATYQWFNSNTLQFTSTRTLQKKEGITVSVTFPKGIFAPYQPTFFEKYSDYANYLWFLLPLIVFVICFYFWLKYGKDPWLNKTIIPEYEIPENLTPMETGVLMTNGVLKNSFISAALIDFAVKGLITIEEIKNRHLFIEKKDFIIKKTPTGKEKENKIEEFVSPEKTLLFNLPDNFLVSSLKNNFYRKIPPIKKSTISALKRKKLITEKGLTFQKTFSIIGIFIIIGLFSLPLSFIENLFITINIVASAVILIIFSFFMPKRTQKGAEVLWKIKGFKLYMETAEKYRQQFYEKENIFEKFLPYAMVFGITNRWIKKMKEIYGEEYFNNYVPAWYVGASIGSFNIDSFTSTLNSISSSISSVSGSASGARGGGFSGGGGGGGGGGGW